MKDYNERFSIAKRVEKEVANGKKLVFLLMVKNQILKLASYTVLRYMLIVGMISIHYI